MEYEYGIYCFEGQFSDGESLEVNRTLHPDRIDIGVLRDIVDELLLNARRTWGRRSRYCSLEHLYMKDLWTDDDLLSWFVEYDYESGEYYFK